MDTVLGLLSRIDFYQAIWLLPVICLAHVAEELPRFVGWAGKFFKVPYTQKKFVAENVVIWALSVASVVATVVCPATSLAGKVATIFVLGIPFGLLGNTILHASSTLKSGVYSPGTVTACLLFPPISIYTLYLAAAQGLLVWSNLIPAIFLGIALLPIIIAIVHRVIDRRIQPATLIKAARFVVIPGVVMVLARQIFDPALVSKVMVYAGPVLLLSLVVKWARNWRKGHEVRT
jgi:hypothetical protein